MKSTAAFKLSKSTKRAAASISDAHVRGAFIRSMIEAEIIANTVPKSKKDKSNNEIE